MKELFTKVDIYPDKIAFGKQCLKKPKGVAPSVWMDKWQDVLHLDDFKDRIEQLERRVEYLERFG